MTVTLVVSDTVAKELDGIASQSLETAGVLLVSVVPIAPGVLRLLAREYHPVGEAAYLRRHEDALTIAAEGYVPALARAEQIGAAALWVHTHPGKNASPMPSAHDDIVDTQLAETFRLRCGSDFYGALILSPSDHGIQFTGHIAADGDTRFQIDRLWCVGDRFRLTHAPGRKTSDVLGMFDRNVRAFGTAVQTTLGDLTIGLVGCGGTGSAVAEQLVRLGVRKFVLVDPDTLSQSNLTRVYGSGASDVGRYKTDVVAQNLTRISPDAQCETVRSMLTASEIAKRLLPCDVVFGCSDDNAGRLVLSVCRRIYSLQ